MQSEMKMAAYLQETEFTNVYFGHNLSRVVISPLSSGAKLPICPNNHRTGFNVIFYVPIIRIHVCI